MRHDFQFITRGKILEELKEEGLERLSFSQLHRFEKSGIIPIARRMGGKWRIYSREEAEKVKSIIWNHYGGKKSYEELEVDEEVKQELNEATVSDSPTFIL